MASAYAERTSVVIGDGLTVKGPRAMSGRFVITGPPGSGKTPIIGALEARGYRCVPEAVRVVLAEHRRDDGASLDSTDPERFLRLSIERAIADLIAVNGVDGPVFFDRGIPDTIGLYDLFGLDASRAWEAGREHRYAGVVFVTPSWPEIYATDVDRRMTFGQAAAYGERVNRIYTELGYDLIEVPRATPMERADLIVRYAVRNGG